ncbi:MAG: DUF488 family protein [Elusimicrobia bacterium]|nr:DUF488 family protein [Elusimicrobiota bacterium]
MEPDIKTKRIYEPALPEDGVRVLVDRVWPRGMTKAKAAADLWLQDAAPTIHLHKWFKHDPSKWREFKSRYFDELSQRSHALTILIDEAERGRLTLLFSSRNPKHNQAVALKEYLLSRSKF